MLYHTDFSLAGVRGRRLHFSIKHGIINQPCKKIRESHGQILQKKEIICLLSVHGGAHTKETFVCDDRVIHFPFVVIPHDGTA